MNDEGITHDFYFFISLIKNKQLKRCCRELRNYEPFWTWVGSIDKHHAFENGLIIHTLEVTKFAWNIGKMFPQINNDILITAALWHDLAKIWDYEYYFEHDLTKKWRRADYHGKIHHVTGSTAEFTAHALSLKIDREIIQKIQHCIIAHHGQKDWGSIRIPESLEAIILHQADYLSATYSAYKK